MFEVAGKEYELKYSTPRVKLIEKQLDGESATHAMIGNDGMMSLTALEVFYKFGLKEAGSDAYVAPAKAVEICNQYMEEHGYTAAVTRIQEAMVRDMGFLFQIG